MLTLQSLRGPSTTTLYIDHLLGKLFKYLAWCEYTLFAILPINILQKSNDVVEFWSRVCGCLNATMQAR